MLMKAGKRTAVPEQFLPWSEVVWLPSGPPNALNTCFSCEELRQRVLPSGFTFDRFNYLVFSSCFFFLLSLTGEPELKLKWKITRKCPGVSVPRPGSSSHAHDYQAEEHGCNAGI